MIVASSNSAAWYYDMVPAYDNTLASKYRKRGTVVGTYCTLITMLIPRKQIGVVANLSHPYVRPTNVNFVVAIFRYRYYFQMNMVMVAIDSRAIL